MVNTTKRTVMVWGTGVDYDNYINNLKYQEIKNMIKIIGITSNQTLYNKIDGYTFIKKNNLINYEFDLLVIANIKKFNEIFLEAINLGIDSVKIINIKVFSLPNFEVDKYILLKHSELSIFANNCWGGITSNRLGLPFQSPFINMFESDDDYMKILQNPHKYIDAPLMFCEYRFEGNLKRNFPVAKILDVKLFFNHYSSFEEAKEKWESRKKRINWNNLFIMMYTTNKDIAKAFSKLPYDKKVCFVPFELKADSILNINIKNSEDLSDIPFWQVINGMAQGSYKFYDVFELLSGKLNKRRIE